MKTTAMGLPSTWMPWAEVTLGGVVTTVALILIGWGLGILAWWLLTDPDDPAKQ